VEPPAGRLRPVLGPEPAPGPAEGEAIPFTGWLGLLRALSEVVGPAVLIMGFMRFVPRPYQRTGQAVDHPHYGG
jgi:hypothetical protein